MTKNGILLIGHGSRMVYNKATMNKQYEELKKMGYENVYIGYNESSLPSIGDAMIQIAKDKIDVVVALPFFIASGLHVTRDIPPKLGLKANETCTNVNIEGQEIIVHFETPFGEDENLTDLLSERVDELKSGKEKTGIIVMGHGSQLNYNHDVTLLNAKRLTERGYENVRIGFNEINEPLIEDVVKEMLESEFDEIIALPLFIASGAHLSEDIPLKLGIPPFTDSAEIDYKGRKVSIKYATPLGADSRLCNVLKKKIDKYF